MPVHITIQGDKFYMDGKLTYSDFPGARPEALGRLMNSRMVQATFEDENPETAKLFVYPDGSVLDPNRQTNEFCAALPEYRRHGVIACTVNFQGGYPQYHVHLRQDQILQNWDNNAFAANGSLKWRYAERMSSILELPSSALLAMEIAVSTEEVDREKIGIYAEAAVAEYWLVLPAGGIIEVYSRPNGSKYEALRTVRGGDVLVSSVLPDLCVNVSDLFA